MKKGQIEQKKQLLAAVVPGEGRAELLQLQHVADLVDSIRRHAFTVAYQGFGSRSGYLIGSGTSF